MTRRGTLLLAATMSACLTYPAGANDTTGDLRLPLGEGPTIGASVMPSKLVLPVAERSVETRIGNAGSVPATVSAVANLSSTRIAAEGWVVRVEAERLEPGESTTVELVLQDAEPSDVSLDVFVAPLTTTGSEGVVLRFPIPVDVEAATPESSARAWATALAGMLATLAARLGEAS